MANGTVGGETCLRVIRVVRLLVILAVAVVAIGRHPSKPPGGVALRAGNVDMGAGQRKLCEPSVIESLGSPARGAMTHGAIAREADFDVARVRRPVIVLHMAAVAIRRSASEAAPDMTRATLESCMDPCQSKARELQVVKLCAEP